jgi:hypothetical protein
LHISRLKPVNVIHLSQDSIAIKTSQQRCVTSITTSTRINIASGPRPYSTSDAMLAASAWHPHTITLEVIGRSRRQSPFHPLQQWLLRVEAGCQVKPDRAQQIGKQISKGKPLWKLSHDKEHRGNSTTFDSIEKWSEISYVAKIDILAAPDEQTKPRPSINVGEPAIAEDGELTVLHVIRYAGRCMRESGPGVFADYCTVVFIWTP